jgi:carbon monoxide dehydrogenase subunit G
MRSTQQEDAVIRTEQDFHVAASPDVVFDRLGDMRNEVQWNPMTQEMAKSTDGEVGSGTRFDGKMRRVGPMHMVVTEYNRPRRFASRGGSRGASVDYAATFEPAEGGTRVRTTMELEPRGIAKVLAPLMARSVAKQEDEAMQSFRRWVEGSGAA